MKKKYDPDLYAPGTPCTHLCGLGDCIGATCTNCSKTRKDCSICPKNKPYELLKTGMIGGPSIVFSRYAESGETSIRSHIYGSEARKCRSVIGYDANSLYLYCAGQEMPCGKERYEEIKKPTEVGALCEKILKKEIFGFVQVDIEVPEKLKDKFSEFSPLFVVDEVPEDLVPEHMKKYKKDTGRKTAKGSKKLLGVLRAKKILLYTPVLKWYLEHGLKVTAAYKVLLYKSSRPFEWFAEEVSSARRDGDNDPSKKQLGDTFKLKGNSFYGKMIEDLEKHTNTKFTIDEKLVDQAFRSPFFADLEEINGAYQISMRKRSVDIKRPYQCGIAVYQLAKLRMLEFYYDFLDKFVDRQDFELIQMDTDSMYMALSADGIDDIIKPDLKDEYLTVKKDFLATTDFDKRTPGLFKDEFKGARMIALTSKCYYADCGDDVSPKISCKGVSKRQNNLTWKRYYEALFGGVDRATNKGFRVDHGKVVTYDQNKLGLSAYYDKRVVASNGIHRRPLY